MTNTEDYSAKSFTSAMTIDVEDGINIAMLDSFNIKMAPTKRVLVNVETILNLFQIHNIRATFFILGEVAEAFPHLAKRIESSGHEIGIHGFHHDQVFRLTPQLFKSEILRAKDLIENQLGHNVFGFRAPAFSINLKTSWAFSILEECGFKYDSSVFPSISPRYGWNGFSKDICRLKFGDSASLIEAPLSVIKFMGINLPVCGGGYLRYLPYNFTKLAFRSIIKERPAIVYLHPYELDVIKYPEYFYRARANAHYKQKLLLMFYRYKKDTVKTKMENMISEFAFSTLYEVISGLEQRHCIPERSLLR